MVGSKLAAKRLILPRPKVCISKTPGGIGVPPGNWHPQAPGVDGRATLTVTPETQHKLPPDKGRIFLSFSAPDCPFNAPVYPSFIWEKGARATTFTEISPTKNTGSVSGVYDLTNTGDRGDDTFLVNALCLNPVRRAHDWFTITWDVAPPPPPPYRAWDQTPLSITVPRGTPVDQHFMWWDSTKALGSPAILNNQQTGGSFTPHSTIIATTNQYFLTGVNRWTRSTPAAITGKTIFSFIIPSEQHTLLWSITWT